MSAAGTLQRGRAAAERLMVDACTISRDAEAPTYYGTGDYSAGGYSAPGPVFNEDTLQYEDVPASVTIYVGKCRVQLGQTMAATPEAGGRVATVQRATLQVPISVTDVAIDDVVVITSAAHDPDLAGTRYRVRSLFHKTHATARRLEVEESQA